MWKYFGSRREDSSNKTSQHCALTVVVLTTLFQQRCQFRCGVFNCALSHTKPWKGSINNTCNLLSLSKGTVMNWYPGCTPSSPSVSWDQLRMDEWSKGSLLVSRQIYAKSFHGQIVSWQTLWYWRILYHWIYTILYNDETCDRDLHPYWQVCVWLTCICMH